LHCRRRTCCWPRAAVYESLLWLNSHKNHNKESSKNLPTLLLCVCHLRSGAQRASAVINKRKIKIRLWRKRREKNGRCTTTARRALKICFTEKCIYAFAIGMNLHSETARVSLAAVKCAPPRGIVRNIYVLRAVTKREFLCDYCLPPWHVLLLSTGPRLDTLGQKMRHESEIHLELTLRRPECAR
jgi:hypothetical protein